MSTPTFDYWYVPGQNFLISQPILTILGALESYFLKHSKSSKSVHKWQSSGPKRMLLWHPWISIAGGGGFIRPILLQGRVPVSVFYFFTIRRFFHESRILVGGFLCGIPWYYHGDKKYPHKPILPLKNPQFLCVKILENFRILRFRIFKPFDFFNFDR